MVKNMVKVALALIATLMIVSCTTYSYFGPQSYVSSSTSAKPKSIEQKSVLYATPDEMANTYDEEYIYDAEGKVSKFRQTEYFGHASIDGKKFISWETSYKTISGYTVPESVSVNGEVFMEITYEVLNAKASGKIVQDITERRVFVNSSSYLYGDTSSLWYADLDAYSVPFDADGKFVTQLTSYGRYGSDTNNYLTLGQDNIVLKHFSFSQEKLSEGISKSYSDNGFFNPSRIRDSFKGKSVNFDYTWQVLGGKICQTKEVFISGENDEDVTFTADIEYNEAGNRTAETWSVIAKGDSKEEPVVVFQQNLKY